MATPPNVNQREKEAALKAEIALGVKTAKLLQGALVKYIGFETTQQTGKLMASTVTERHSKEGLVALAIKSPKYGFMLNYGFEGVKSNGISMKLQPTNHLANAIEQSRVLEILGDELTAIKGDKVMASINFKLRG